MTHSEPELLALRLQELVKRQATLRAVLRQALNDALTDQERADIHQVIGELDHEIAALERRLQSLLGAGGTG